MDQFSEWFWQDSFWYPKGVSFKDLKDEPGLVYPKSKDLLFVPVFSLLIYGLRILFERYIALPIARRYKLQSGRDRKQPKKNVDLEKFYREKSNQPSISDMEALAKRVDWSVMSVRNWFRRKRNWNRPSIEAKFCETSWRCLFYTVVFAYGMWSLWKSPWFWDTYQCWVGFPRHSLETSTYLYYMLELSFYMSLLFTVMGDIRRKDFKEQLIHHVATIFLLAFSYVPNFVRIGTLVMAVHDISDVFLEGAKCLHYLRYNSLADATFVVFAVTFFITRIFILPFWVIHTSYVKSLEVIGHFTSCYYLNALLMLLQCLHFFWGSIILKMAYKMMTQGELTKDERSDVEEQSSDEDSSHEKKNGRI